MCIWLRNDEDRSLGDMHEPIRDGSDHDALNQAGAALSDYEKISVSGFGEGGQLVGGITDFFDGLVLNTTQVDRLDGLFEYDSLGVRQRVAE
jgi:hypothetical protein